MTDTSSNVAKVRTKPVLIFVIGPPQSGKTEMCKQLMHFFQFEYLFLDNEVEDMTSDEPSEYAKHVKSTFSAAEIESFKYTLQQGLLETFELTPRFLKEYLFPPASVSDGSRTVVESFPWTKKEWTAFRDVAKDKWTPETGVATVLISLRVDKEVAAKRNAASGHICDAFEASFDEFEANYKEILEVMKGEKGVEVIEIDTSKDPNMHEVVDKLEDMAEMKAVVEAHVEWQSQDSD